MKYAIIEIPTEIHTELTKAMLKLRIESTTIGISDDNDMILKCAYDEQVENEMDDLRAFAHLLKLFKILDRMQKREKAKAA